MRATTRMLTVAALTVCVSLATASAASAATYEVSTHVNGTVKAHAVYYQNGHTLCTNLLNAPNPSAYSLAQLIHPSDGRQLAALDDKSNDGQRRCYHVGSSWSGESLLLRSTFRSANGNFYVNQMWIVK